MTDRELLELAAKAAGYEYTLDSDGIYHWWDHAQDPAIYLEWNPLKDDGDALRLMVQLNITVMVDCESGFIDIEADDGEIRFGLDMRDYVNDPYATTRRAIVRAAAAMVEDEE